MRGKLGLFGRRPPPVDASLLLNFNGTNGSNTFTDSSVNAFAMTANGDAEISTAQFKYGGASGYFDGDGDYLSTPDDPAFSFGTGDFTIELWFYALSFSAAYAGLVGKGRSAAHASDNWSLELDTFTNGVAFWNWASFSSVGASGLSTSTWYHVAVTRDAGVVRLFLDGVLEDESASLNGEITYDATGSLTVGANVHNVGARPFEGYIDDLRIIKGRSIYDAGGFTPPASQLTATV